jgi:hypothetical protein
VRVVFLFVHFYFVCVLQSVTGITIGVPSGPRPPPVAARVALGGGHHLSAHQRGHTNDPPPILPRQSSIPSVPTSCIPPLVSKLTHPQITIPQLSHASDLKDAVAKGPSLHEPPMLRKPSLQTPHIIQPPQVSTNPFNPFYHPPVPSQNKLAPTMVPRQHQLKFEPANPEPVMGPVTKPIVKISDDSGPSGGTSLLMSTLMSEHGSRRSSRETTASLSRSRAGSGCLSGFQTPKRGSYSSLMPSAASSVAQVRNSSPMMLCAVTKRNRFLIPLFHLPPGSSLHSEADIDRARLRGFASGQQLRQLDGSEQLLLS